MTHLQLLFYLLVVPQLVTSGGNTENGQYRLKENLIPLNYDIELTLQNDFGTTGKFFGNVNIHFNAIAITNEIKLHSKNLTFASNAIQISRKVPGSPVTITDVSFNSTLEFVTISIQHEFSLNSTYTLTVTKFEGVLGIDVEGFYRKSYRNVFGQLEWVALTHLQATNARKVFPCFDEPQYKAKFDIRINHPHDYHAVSNGEVASVQRAGKLTKTIFRTTPIMSSYLVAFAVTKFAGMTIAADNIKYTVWSSLETIRDGHYALSISPQLLKVMNIYTKIPYSISGLSKLDQLSIPNYSAGGMENWGLVVYGDTSILWDPYEYSSRDKLTVGILVAHELSHMWFGNLVTTKWWSTTWLNEGFATFFSYVTLAKIEKDWELDLQFIVEELQPVLVTDAFEKSKPLTNPNVFTVGDISEIFNSISYSKGASIVRMMLLFLGKSSFYEGLSAYLNSRKFSTSEPEDLFSKLQEKVDNNNNLPDSISVIMNSWTVKHGYPLITVTILDNNLILTQSQFFSNSTPPTRWYIPVSYTTSSEKQFNSITIRKWMLPNESETVLSNVCNSQTDWVLLNVGLSAFVRVNYDDSLWNRLQQALKKTDFDGITPINRALIVDDALNLARADILPYEKAFSIISFLEKDCEYYPWNSAFKSFDYLRRRINQKSTLGHILNKYIQRMMSSVYKSVSFVSNRVSHVQNLKKALILWWACKLAVVDCISQAHKLFNNYKNNNITIDPNIRGLIYCTVVRNTEKMDNWEYLWRKLETNTRSSETSNLISSLGCTKNKEYLVRYLDGSINDNSTISRPDRQAVFSAVISGNPEGVSVGLKFLCDHFQKILTSYEGTEALVSVIADLADRLTLKSDIVQLKSLIASNLDKLKDVSTEVDSFIENAEKDLKWVNQHEKELLQYLEDLVSDDYGRAKIVMP